MNLKNRETKQEIMNNKIKKREDEE